MTITHQHTPVSTAGNGLIITVSSSSDDGHAAANTLSGGSPLGDLESRWSAKGDGEWIQYDLGEKEALVKSIHIAFYQGDKRKNYFDIQLSSDAVRWSTVTRQGNASSGTSSTFETFDFPKDNCRGRYVRILGHGNSVNTWNSVLKVKIDFTKPQKTATGVPVLVPGNKPQKAPLTPTKTLTPIDDTAQEVCLAKPVWFENFESLAIGSYWRNNKHLQVVAAVGGGADTTTKKTKKCLRVTYVPSAQGSERLTTRQNLPPALEYTLNYDLLFENGFEFVRGGKLPGLFPTHYTVGCKEKTLDGWSVRAMWKQEGEAILYVYDQNRERHCGNVTSSGVKFGINTWHALSLYVKVNQPASSSNGVVSLYMDGTRIAHIDNSQLRGVDKSSDTLVTQFIFNTFFGGHDPTWAPTKTVYSQFGNFAVYRGLHVRHVPGKV